MNNRIMWKLRFEEADPTGVVSPSLPLVLQT